MGWDNNALTTTGLTAVSSLKEHSIRDKHIRECSCKSFHIEKFATQI